MTQHYASQHQPIRITERNYFVKFAKLLGVRPDWHEPDEQQVTARVEGTSFDNAGFWPHPEEYTSKSVEQYVTIAQYGVDVAYVNLATLCAWASTSDTASKTDETHASSEAYWRAKIVSEIRDIADVVRRECYTSTTGVALAALVENVATKIGVSPSQANDISSPTVMQNTPTIHRKLTWQEYYNSLTRNNQWAHCGSHIVHDTHLHTITMNEGSYPDVRCVGTPQLRVLRGVTPPPSIDV